MLVMGVTNTKDETLHLITLMSKDLYYRLNLDRK